MGTLFGSTQNPNQGEIDGNPPTYFLLTVVDRIVARISDSKYYNSDDRKVYVPYKATADDVLDNVYITIRYHNEKHYTNGSVSILAEQDITVNANATNFTVGETDNCNFLMNFNKIINGANGFVTTTDYIRIVLMFQHSEILASTSSSNFYEEPIDKISVVASVGHFTAGENIAFKSGELLSVKRATGRVDLIPYNEIDTFLTQRACYASCGNVGASYPTKIKAKDIMQDGLITIVYTLADGNSFEQKISISYYEPLLSLSFDVAEVGSQNAPIYVGEDGKTIEKNNFSAFGIHHNNNTSGNTTITYEDVTEDAVWSKDTYTQEDVEELSVDPDTLTRNPDQVLIQYTAEDGQVISNYLNIYLEINEPREVIINGSDQRQNYFEGQNSYFVEPVFTLQSGKTNLYSIRYVDGSTEDIDLTTDVEDGYPKFGKMENGLFTELEDGVDILPNTHNGDKLYVQILLKNGYTITGAYDIYTKQDYIASISCTPSFTFVLGNRLGKYKNNFSVTANHANTCIAPETDYQNFVFDYTALVMSSADLGNSITIKINGVSFTINDISGISFVNPTVSDLEIIDEGDFKQTFQNNLQKVDVSDMRFRVKYANSEYTEEVSWATNNTLPNNTSDKFIVSAYDIDADPETQILTSLNDINGTNLIQITTTAPKINCELRISVNSRFGYTSVNNAKVIPFMVMALQQILGIRIVNPYRKYKIGEKFLNDSDTTKAMLFYKAVDNLGTEYIDSTTIFLKQDIPTLSINYAKGTEWTQPDSSKRITVCSVFDTSVVAEYTIEVDYDGYVSGSKTNDLAVVWQQSVVLPDGTTYTEENGVLAIYNESDTYIDENGIRQVVSLLDPEPKGYIKNIFDTDLLDSQAIMVLFDDYIPPVEGSANITITYPSYTGLADNINKCTFGILFGNNNANNRLFVSGNPNVPNADWHSAETNAIHSEGEVENINGDFSYFPAENIMYYGETDNKVIGYDIVSNDKLLVLKDKSDKEKTVYFRTPTLVTALDATGVAMEDVQGNTMYQEEFALVKGNNSVAGINPHAIANLNGDTLFIDDDNTVQGLDLTGIIGDNQRYANSRSRYIDNRLKDLDLTDAFLWTNNKYLFLSIKDEGIYATHVDAKGGESGQYEWWRLQSENPTCFVEIDDVVYFGNENGDFYQMRNGEYRDEYKIFINEGQGIMAQINDSSAQETINGVIVPAESIIVDQTIFNKMFPTDKPYYDEQGNQIRHLYFKSVNTTTTYIGSMFQQVGSINNNNNAENVDLLIEQDSDGVFYLKVVGKVNGKYSSARQLELIKLLKENTNYYLNYFKEEGAREVKCNSNSLFYNNYSNVFRLVYVGGDEFDKYTMKIYNTTTKEWDNIDLQDLYRANLVMKVDGEYEIFEVDPETTSFKIKDENGKRMDIVRYGNQGTTFTFSGEVIERRNVVAYYITAPFTMGNLNYFKTIWQITLTNDTGNPSEYDLAVASNKIPSFDTKDIASISKAMIGLNFLDFTFKAVDFDKDVVPRTYTIQRTLGMQKFVCFALKNDNNSNAILSSLSVIYTIPFPSYGSD